MTRKPSGDFYSRTTKWKDDKKKKAEQSKEDKDKVFLTRQVQALMSVSQEELMNCTFAPSTNFGAAGPSPRALRSDTVQTATERL